MLLPPRPLPESDKNSIQRYITYIYEWLNSDYDIYFVKKTGDDFKRPEIMYFREKFNNELISFRKSLNNLSSSFEKIIEYMEGYKFEAEREKTLKKQIVNKEEINNK